MVESRWGRRLGPASLALAGCARHRVDDRSARRAGSRGRRRIARRPPVTAAGASTGAARGSGWSRCSWTARAAASGWTSVVGGRRRGPGDLDAGVVRVGTGRRARSSSARTTDDARRCRSSTRRLAALDAGRDVDRCHPARDRAARMARRSYEFRVRRVDPRGPGRVAPVPRRPRRPSACCRRSPPTRRFGRTWPTELGWSDRRASARGRVLRRGRLPRPHARPTTGAVADRRRPELGIVVGLVDDALVVRGACRGLPCPRPAHRPRDRATGRCSTPPAGAVELRRDAGGRPVVVLDRLDGRRWPRWVIDAVAGVADGASVVGATSASPWRADRSFADRPAARLVRRAPIRPVHVARRSTIPTPSASSRRSPHDPDPIASPAPLAVLAASILVLARSRLQRRRLTTRTRSSARPVGGRPGPDVPLAVRRRAGRRDQDGHPRGRGRQQRHEGVAGGDLPLCGQRPEPHRLRAGATCGVNGIALLHPERADGGFTMWLREHGRAFDWGTLRWCQMYASRPTAATTPRPSPSTSSATSRSSTTT